MTNDQNLPAVKDQPAQQLSVFSNAQNFELAQRMATALCKSDLVPQNFKGNLPNTMVALSMAARIGADPLMVMQNLNVIHGRPSWSSQFIIAALNSCGRFSPLRFTFRDLGPKNVPYTYWVGDKPNRTRKEGVEKLERNLECIASAVDKSTGETLSGPPVTFETAVLEGWWTKSDSKWKTMPDLMLRYRAAAFFGRLYAPDVLMGMKTAEELIDADFIEGEVVAPRETAPARDAASVAAEINATARRGRKPKESPAESPPATQTETASAATVSENENSSQPKAGASAEVEMF